MAFVLWCGLGQRQVVCTLPAPPAPAVPPTASGVMISSVFTSHQSVQTVLLDFYVDST